LTGPKDAPVVAVLGGISAHRIVAGGGRGLVAGNRRRRGSASIPALPGSRHRLSRRPRREFDAGLRRQVSAISSYDQAAGACSRSCASGLKSLHAIVGASYGGMVALCFAERYPSSSNTSWC
jgi:homoserine O-acetyltransferase